MISPRPTLVASDSRMAQSIAERLSKRSGHSIATCPFTSCRDQIIWHETSLLLLVIASADDVEAAVDLTRENRLRQTALSVVIVRAGDAVRDERLERLAPDVHSLVTWPDATDKLVDMLRAGPSSGVHELADLIASRLRSLTPSLVPLAGQLAESAKHDVPVLLTGETGTGKTYLARLLHEYSPRSALPFLVVPCGALPTNILESTLFGHIRGAFTGADQTRPGKFAAAGDGTILLDEIDVLPLAQQAALLRVIETGEYEQVGGNTTLKSKARVIVASNLDLKQAIERNEFREDLFYRLEVMPFHLAPLRDRPQDVLRLARGFAAQYSHKFHKRLRDIAPEAQALIVAFPWPGNIRELENAIQKAVLMSTGPELTPADLPEKVRRHLPCGLRTPATQSDETLMSGRAEFESWKISQALEAHGQNRSRTAKSLGISRVTLHKKIKQHGLAILRKA